MNDPTQVMLPGSDGLDLSVWDYGGQGPLLLLGHCTGTLGRVWDPVVAALNGAYRCVAPDTRGQGDSGVPGSREGFAWTLSGRDLLAVLDALQAEGPVFAAGHSAGAAHVAYAARAQPERFSRLVLIDGIIGPAHVFTQPNPLAERVERRVNEFDRRDAARERLTSKPPMASWHAAAVDAYLEHALRERADGRVELKCPGEREAIFYELGGASDLFEELEQIALPTLVVTASDSYVKPLAEVQQSKLPDSVLVVIEGAGHFVAQEKPEDVAKAIVRWCQ